MDLVGRTYHRFVSLPRARVLAQRLAPLLPRAGTVLDIGCGDGALQHELARLRPGLRFQGLDVDARGAVMRYDGRRVPFDDESFDVALLVDTVHHADDPKALLREACRVGRRVVLKDHLLEGVLAGATLRFMDRAGNARNGTALPHHYFRREAWRTMFSELGMRATTWNERLAIYPRPARWLFDRELHFAAWLDPLQRRR